MSISNAIECSFCELGEEFEHVEDIHYKRVNIDGKYFTQNRVILRCVECGYEFEFDIHKAWKNSKSTNKLRDWITSNGFPF